MNDVQQELLSMYKDIRTVLDRNGIRHYGGFGTAIGALRHKGFIPWDDDIDLVVWAEDVPEMESVLMNELDPKKYYFHISSADTHPHVIAVCDDFEKALREETATFIDIFLIEGHPRGKVRDLISRTLYSLEHLSIFLIAKIKTEWVHRQFEWIPRTLGKISKMPVENDSDNTVILNVMRKNDYFPASYFGKGKEVPFEDTTMPMPDEVDKMLRSTYGDYMTLPPEDKRQGAAGFPCGAYIDYLADVKKGKRKIGPID